MQEVMRDHQSFAKIFQYRERIKSWEFPTKSSNIREVTEFTSGEGPGIFLGGARIFFDPWTRGAKNFFMPGQGGRLFFHDTFF